MREFVFRRGLPGMRGFGEVGCFEGLGYCFWGKNLWRLDVGGEFVYGFLDGGGFRYA